MNRAVYNNYPHSAYANASGIKRLIGNSKSILFDEDRFNEYATDSLQQHIRSFKEYNEAVKYIKKLSVVSGLEYFESTIYSIAVKKNHLALVEDYGRWNIIYYSIAVGRIRDTELDEIALLLSYATKCKCIVCEKDVADGYSNIAYTYDGNRKIEQIFTFDIDNSHRSEYVCADCQSRDMDFLKASFCNDQNSVMSMILRLKVKEKN